MGIKELIRPPIIVGEQMGAETPTKTTNPRPRTPTKATNPPTTPKNNPTKKKARRGQRKKQWDRPN